VTIFYFAVARVVSGVIGARARSTPCLIVSIRTVLAPGGFLLCTVALVLLGSVDRVDRVNSHV